MKDYKQITLEVCRVAREAGAYLRGEQKKLRTEQIVQKRAHDYVSYVDRTSEEMIVSRLRQLIPEAGFLTEEGTTGERHSESVWWVIDPLDGTTNYIHGFNPFAVSIALRNRDEVLLGVVYEVSLDECFYAWKGGGAWLNDDPIHVNAAHDVTQALLGIELPYDADAYRQTGCRFIAHFYGLCSGVRMNGSAAVGLCNVACGRWDGWLERGICQWDFMAAALIILEAGGTVTNYSGKSFFLDGDDIVASNGIIHNELIQCINNQA